MTCVYWCQSHKGNDATDRIRRVPFRLDAHSVKEPTRFECSFTLEDHPSDSTSNGGAVYDLDVEFTESEILLERLRRTVRHERRSTHTLYTRRTEDGRVGVDVGIHLQGENHVTANVTRPNSLFLSAAAQNNHPQLTRVHKWFADGWRCMFSTGPMPEQVAAEMVVDHRQRDWLDSLLKQAEAGVGGIEVREQELDDRSLEFTRDLAGFISDHAGGESPDLHELVDRMVDSSSRRLRLLHESKSGLLPLDYESESRGTRMFLTLGKV